MNERQTNYVVRMINELQEYLTAYCKDEKPLVKQINRAAGQSRTKITQLEHVHGLRVAEDRFYRHSNCF